MAPAFFNGIDMLSSPIFYLYSFDLYLYSCFFAFYIYLEEFFVHIFYVHIFFGFYRLGGMNNGPPPPQEPGFHPGDEPFALNVTIP